MDIKKQSSVGLKALGEDRFRDVLKLSKFFTLFKVKIRNIHENKKVEQLHIILAYKTSEHWVQ